MTRPEERYTSISRIYPSDDTKLEARRVSSHGYITRETPNSIIIRTPRPKITFAFMGCFGNGGSKQKAVAEALYTAEKDGVECVIFLGDNVYDDGIKSIDDPELWRKIYNVYSSKLIKFALNGNHEHDCYWAGKKIRGAKHQAVKFVKGVGETFGIETLEKANDDENYSGAHFFAEHASQWLERDAKLPQLISLHDSPPVNSMIGSGQYYSIKFVADGEDDDNPYLEVFMVDSTIFVNDDKQPEWLQQASTRQQQWLQKAISNSKAPRKVIATHHPIATAGARYKDHSEWELYHDPAPKRDEVGSHGFALYRALRNLLGDDTLKDIIFMSAHDHHSAAIDLGEGLPVQFVSGGGGGEGQEFKNPHVIANKQLKFAYGDAAFATLTCNATSTASTSPQVFVSYYDDRNDELCRFEVTADNTLLNRMPQPYDKYAVHHKNLSAMLVRYCQGLCSLGNERYIEKLYQLFIALTALCYKTKDAIPLKNAIFRMPHNSILFGSAMEALLRKPDIEQRVSLPPTIHSPPTSILTTKDEDPDTSNRPTSSAPTLSTHASGTIATERVETLSQSF